ncbi:outer membrane protein assembly factor BamB family protein [Paenibacillus sp. MMO-58]|uniref:outer membrane protein assembly factor BamB family protein n=1 Tax=Paenibacillus sp. MMO-58 TaxID=3081290 RepID=UPI0030195FC3
MRMVKRISRFIILCMGILMAASSVSATGTLTQIPVSQFTTIKIDGQSHGQFRGNAAFLFDSLAPEITPKELYYSPITKWTYALDNFNVFKGVDEDVLFAFDSSGKLAQKTIIQEQGYQQLIPGKDTLFVYVLPSIMLHAAKPNVLYAFDLKGKLKWKYTFTEPQQMFSPVWQTGPQDAFYTVTSDAIVCIRDGKLAWKMKVPSITNNLNLKQVTTVSLRVDSSGNVYILDQNGWIEKRDIKQQLVWREKLGSALFEVIGNDRYLVSSQHLKHTYFDANTGKRVKEPKIDYASYNRFTLPNDRKGGFYAPEKEDSYGLPSGNGVVKFNEKGQIIWHYKLRFSGYSSIAPLSLMSDDQGNVYFLDNGGHLYSLDSNGNERFIVLTRDINRSYTPLYVSPEGVAVSANGDAGIYKVTIRKK